MRDARHLGGDGTEGFAFPIRILGIRLDIPRILFAKRILPHPNRPIRGHPEGIAEPRIAMLREPAHPTELSGLLRAEIESTELEKLSVMRKPAQVPGFRQNRERKNRSHSRQGAQPLIIGLGLKRLVGLVLNRGPGGAEVLMFRQHHTEHLDGLGVFRHSKPDALTRGGIEVGEDPALIHFAAHHRPRLVRKGVWRIARDGGGTGKPVQQMGKPLGAGIRVIPFGLREIQREVMGHDAMLNLDLPQRDLIVGLSELLEIVHTVDQRIVISLNDAGFEQMEQDLCVLRIILIPRVVERIARPRYCEGGNEAQLEAALAQILGQGAMVVARGFKPNEDRRLQRA